MPKWIHDRAEHILAKNRSMPKSEAFAIATQQAHSVNKSPKGYGTAEGRRTAKSKYDTPKDDKKMANPGDLKSEKMASKDEHEEAGDHFKDLSRELWKDKGKEKKAMMVAFFDELEKIAKEKDSGAFDRFMGGAGGKVSLPAARQAAPTVQPRLARQTSFTPAVVGHGGMPGPAAKKPLPSGALNPGGGMH